MAEEFTVLVPKGCRVNVEERNDITGGDSRIGKDRNLVLKGGANMKVAISRASESASAGASVVTMCG